jgi:hypothetical protein
MLLLNLKLLYSKTGRERPFASKRYDQTVPLKSWGMLKRLMCAADYFSASREVRNKSSGIAGYLCSVSPVIVLSGLRSH